MVDPKASCCFQTEGSQLEASWITGKVKTTAGGIPVVDTSLHFSDKFRSFLARCAIRRNKYRIVPGLYAVGHPSDNSPVLVSANYKLSFDHLRSNLGGIDSWILVLDTKGINVWCAAGKGTFGTKELVNRIRSVHLDAIVTHRRLILPQLGAPGVSAHTVREQSGFHVIYGPVRAQELPKYLKAKMKATPEMRKVSFDFYERIRLVPAELVLSAKYLFGIMVIFLILSGLGEGTYSFNRVITHGFTSIIILFLLYLLGNALPPALLPWLPGRMFSIKGAWLGLVLTLGYGGYALYHPNLFQGALDSIAWVFIIPAITSLITMNFTGSSTYTSLSGVRKEIQIALPIQVSVAVIGVGLWIGGLFL